jgi:hypothetical protein
MAQDSVLDWISGHLQKAEREKVSAALTRMGIRDEPKEWESLRWEFLVWFVRFAQRNISALSEEECGQLDEEVQVIQLLASFNLNPWIPNREELKALRDRVFRILSDLVITGSARIGPIPVEFVVWRGTIKHAALPEAQRSIGAVILGGLPSLIGHPPAEGIAFQVAPIGVAAVIHCLAQLLSKYPASVRRCPFPDCGKLFVPIRSTGEYCSRQCQSRAFAREQWKEKKEKNQQGARLIKEAAKKPTARNPTKQAKKRERAKVIRRRNLKPISAKRKS